MSESTDVWRGRPVFVTSTFRDMQAERDYLRARVFPEIEERLRARRCHLEPIDLRWGVETSTVAEEQARALLVLTVCLAEVERSRPFLIGLLGDRYGWVPPAERMAAAAQEAGFDRDVAGRSVTELEIDFGVLANPNQQQRCLFYFRTPLPYGDMPTSIAGEYSEHYSEDPGATEATSKLSALKQRIRTALGPERVRDYTATWDATTGSVTGLEAWGRMVLEDLWRDLDAETRDRAVAVETSWQAAERWALEQFVEDRARSFVGRASILAELRAWATSPVADTKVLGTCVTGDAGAGKSTLFARVLGQLRGEGVFVLAHAAGISPRSTQVNAMLRRWVEDLAASEGIDAPVSDSTSAEEMEPAFHRLLGQVSARRRVVVLIDALNQFEPTTRAQHLTWLPKNWPANARLIATAIPGTESAALAERPWAATWTLPPLRDEEGREMAEAICQRYHRRLADDVLTALMAKRREDQTPAGGNPLWLELAVEELNLLGGEHFTRAEREFTGTPGERPQRLLLTEAERMPAEVPAMYNWMLHRAEHPVDRVWGAAWAQAFVNLIAMSLAGWRESDLRELMPTLSGEPWDDLKFAVLRRTFRAHLKQRGPQAQWYFAHAQMRVAVAKRNLRDAGTVRRIHEVIAAHLAQLPRDDPLHETEIMLHLIGADERERAARYYGADLTAGEAAGATSALAAHVLAVGGAWVISLLGQLDVDDDTTGRLCRRFVFDLHDAIRRNDAPLAVRRTLTEGTMAWLQRLAAHDPYNADWQRVLAVGHGRLGDVLVAQGDRASALAAYRAALAISERLAAQDPRNTNWQRDLSVSYTKLGDVLVAQGDRADALAAYRAAFAIAERLAAQDPHNPVSQHDLAVSHERLGDVLVAQGDRADALAAYRAGMAISVRLAAQDPHNADWQRALSVSYTKLGDVLVAQGDRADALAAYRTALAIAERLRARDPHNADWQHDLSVSYEKLGDVLVAQGDRADALVAYRAGMAIFAGLAAQDPYNADWQRALASSHARLGDVLMAEGNRADALAACRAALAIAERLAAQDPRNTDWQHDLSLNHTRLGDVLGAHGDRVGAHAAYRAGHSILEGLAAHHPHNADWQRDLSVSHDRLGDVLMAEEDGAGALAAYRAALAIAERLATQNPRNADWQRDLSFSYERVGNALSVQGDLAGALATHRARHGIAERLAAQDPHNADWQRDLSVSHNKLGDVLAAQGDRAGALAAYSAAFAIDERLAAQDSRNAVSQRDLVVSCFKLAVLFQASDRTAAAPYWARCRETLLAMRAAGMELDPPLVRLLEQLTG